MVRITKKVRLSASYEEVARVLLLFAACIAGSFFVSLNCRFFTFRQPNTVGKGGALRFQTIPNVVRNVPLLPMHAT